MYRNMTNPPTEEDLRRRREDSEHQEYSAIRERRRPRPERPGAIIVQNEFSPAAFQHGAVNAQVPAWDRLQGHGPVPTETHLHGHPQAPIERWEQVPLGIQLMNEIADALTIGSDFAFWGKYSPGSFLAFDQLLTERSWPGYHLHLLRRIDVLVL